MLTRSKELEVRDWAKRMLKNGYAPEVLRAGIERAIKEWEDAETIKSPYVQARLKYYEQKRAGQ